MLPLYRPTIRRADMDAVLRRLAEDSIGAGELSREFSQGLAKYLGRRSGVSMRTVGAALRAALTSLGLPPGARVGMSALAHGYVFRVVERLGFTPVVVDTQRILPVLPSPLDFDYEPLSLDCLYVDSRLGFIADVEGLRQIRVPLIEDVSEGLGGNTGREMVGSAGELTIIGLEPEHIITAGGGATVVTNNSKRVSVLAAATDPGGGEASLPDMNAAMALTQMRQLEKFIERRRELVSRFLRTIQRGRHTLPLQGGEGDAVFPALPVLVESSPRDVEQYARTHGVSAGRAFPETALTLLSDADHDVTRTFPNALSLAGRMVLFPLYPTLGKTEQETIERILATMP
ncbi:MAG: DegT/DnrJ/EryC1/StrS family aminotransferase [Alkalispirochaeta sp.]